MVVEDLGVLDIQITIREVSLVPIEALKTAAKIVLGPTIPVVIHQGMRVIVYLDIKTQVYTESVPVPTQPCRKA